MSKLIRFLKILLIFAKNIFGIIQTPHATYLKIANKGVLEELIPIWLFAFISLFWVGAVKYGVFDRPFFFAVNFFLFFSVCLFSFFLVSILIYFLGKLFTQKKEFKTILLLWGYSYIPTTVWFIFISVIFYFFPPPRGFTIKGYTLSGILVSFSIALFYWKLLLYYLTLRIGFKITWGKIIKISLLFFPAVAFYSYALFKLGIFKVPFL